MADIRFERFGYGGLKKAGITNALLKVLNTPLCSTSLHF
jgi:hypothetical protein